MVRDYVETYYEPAAARAKTRRANGDASARELAAWRQRVTGAWDQLAIAAVHWPQGDLRLGAPVEVGVSVRLGSLEPDDIAVQLVAGPVEQDGELRAPSVLELRPEGEPDGDGNRHFTGSVVGEQAGSIGLAVRIVPHHRDLTAWTDLGLVRWAPDERRR